MINANYTHVIHIQIKFYHKHQNMFEKSWCIIHVELNLY
jgi:hypothetical protein